MDNNNNKKQPYDLSDEYIICNTCGENLGLDRPNWGVEHLKKYPNHRSYRGVRKTD
jgi:hypothetical protein